MRRIKKHWNRTTGRDRKNAAEKSKDFFKADFICVLESRTVEYFTIQTY